MGSLLRTIKNIFLGKPILAVFDATKLCNQCCPMCNIRKAQSALMDLDMIWAHAKKPRDFGIGYVFLQGDDTGL